MHWLLWANLNRKRLRLILTIASIAIAFILFSLMEALKFALTGGVAFAGQDRLITINKYTLMQPLPSSYLARVQSMPGVRAAISVNWFGGYYQTPRNQVLSFAVQNEPQFLEVYPEITIPPEQFHSWLMERDGALIGRALAEFRHWKPGDVIPIRANVYRKNDGSDTWDIRIAGVFDSTSGSNNNGMYFHYSYFNESVSTFGRDAIGQIVLRVQDKAKSETTGHAVDALFANSPTETKTASESALVQGFVNQLGNIGKIFSLIISVVFFTILMAGANSMSQSVRERTNEIAMMKALGFSRARVAGLILAESLSTSLFGGAIGLSIGAAMVKSLAVLMHQFLPMFALPADAYVLGTACMVVLGVLSGLLPALGAWQLKVSEALRHT